MKYNVIYVLCIVGVILVISQFYLGYRINSLYWKDIYKSTRRPSLKRLKKSLESVTNMKDKQFVTTTIYLYYFNLFLWALTGILIILSFV